MTIADETGLKRVALSGGCFQNRLLLEGLIETLEEQGLTVFSHQQVPTNDGGIALGQAVVAGPKLSGIQSEVQTHG
jgi:hydrogenase maturation protein HypF